jgi:PAS domain S-box-containing protein
MGRLEIDKRDGGHVCPTDSASLVGQTRTSAGQRFGLHAELACRGDHHRHSWSRQRAHQELAQRKLAQEELRVSEERYRSILNASPDAIFITDLKDGRHLMVSPGAVTMFGCTSEDELVGTSHGEFIVPEDRERAAVDVALTLRGKSPGPIEYLGLRQDASTFAFEANSEIVRDAEGRPNQIVTIIRDITERKRVERELREAAEDVRTLRGILPICSSCKKIRDDQGGWSQVEVYVRDRTNAEFSHGLCPDCIEKLYPEQVEENASGR